MYTCYQQIHNSFQTSFECMESNLIGRVDGVCLCSCKKYITLNDTWNLSNINQIPFKGGFKLILRNLCEVEKQEVHT